MAKGAKKLSEELQTNDGLRAAIDAKVQMNWAERLEGFITSYKEYIAEAEKVIEMNTVIKEIAEESPKHHKKIVRESIEGFNMIIESQKTTIDTINLKIAAAERLLVIVKENKTVAIHDFLTDFDLVAGKKQ